jgi:hypothetical protein
MGGEGGGGRFTSADTVAKSPPDADRTAPPPHFLVPRPPHLPPPHLRPPREKEKVTKYTWTRSSPRVITHLGHCRCLHFVLVRVRVE